MAEEDELLKRYLADDNRYADLINGVSFGRKQVIRAEDLSDRDTQTGYHKSTRAVKERKKQNTGYRNHSERTACRYQKMPDESRIFIRFSKERKATSLYHHCHILWR